MTSQPHSHCLNELDTEQCWLPQPKDTQIAGAAVEMQAKAELIDLIRSRYYGARKRDKSRILDEFVAITGHQRKYALRILAESQIAVDSGLRLSQFGGLAEGGR